MFRGGSMKRGLLVATAALITLAGCGPLPGTPKAKARHAILQMVFDPGAAKIVFLNQTDSAVCGSVNGKNRMGAYVGATPFIYDRSLDMLSVYAGAPEASDVRYLADTSAEDPEWKTRLEELSEKCRFPENWKNQCGIPSPASADPGICKGVLGSVEDFRKLMDQYSHDPY